VLLILFFLIDVSGSMGPVISDLVRNVSLFIDTLTTKDANNSNPIKDWRGKVVGYRNINHDGSNWFVDNPFVRDADILKAQLNGLNADGGGDEPESLLDALYQVVTVPASSKGHESPGQWRYRSVASRVVIVFTDASFHPSFKIPDGGGTGGLDDIRNAIMANRIFLFFFCPEMECYDKFSDLDNSEFEMIPFDSDSADGPVRALRDFTGDTNNFKALAVSISMACF
jgi:hypothetical protein